MTSKNHKSSEDKKAFLDCLTDFLGNSEGQSKEEVQEELREQGIDIDSMISSCKAMINEKVSEAKRQWLTDAPTLRLKMQQKMESCKKDMPTDINIIKTKIKEMMETGEYREQAVACFSNFNEMTEDDLRNLYNDFIMLVEMKRNKGK